MTWTPFRLCRCKLAALFLLAGIPNFFSSNAAADPSATGAGTADKPRNVIVILADDLGWGSLGCYGATLVKTPNLDRLASEGIKIMDAYAPSSVCSPSRYAIMTGRFYWRTTQDPEVLPEWAPFHEGLDRTTLASLLKSAGYATGAIGKWHLGIGTGDETDWNKPLTPGPLEAGFDYFYGMAANSDNLPMVYIENHNVAGQAPGTPITFTTGKFRVVTATNVTDPRTDVDAGPRFCAKALKFIDDHKDVPFFLYYAPNEVHDKITPSPEYVGTSKAGPYGDFIQQLDGEVGKILQKLDDYHLSQNTLVLFTSDNGGVVVPFPAAQTSDRPQAVAEKLGFSQNGPLRDGKHSVHEGGFRVPFIVRWPGHIPAGVTSTAVVTLADVLATLSDAVHQPIPPKDGEDSFDLMPVLMNQTTDVAGRDFSPLYSAQGNYALRSGSWKYIELRNDAWMTPGPNTPAWESTGELFTLKHSNPNENAWQLYNLDDDLGEKKNLYQKDSPEVTKLQGDLDQVRKDGRSHP
jgi:arylsulfatase A-like enzyme